MDTGASPDTAQTSEELPATPGMAESRPANGNGISHSSDDGSHTGQTHNTDDMATPPDTPHAALTTDDVSPCTHMQSTAERYEPCFG